MREAKVLITSENRSSGGFKSASQDLTGFEAVAKRVGQTLTTAFTATAIIAVGKKITDFGLEATKAFGDVERTMIQLKTAVGGSESSFSRLTGLIDDMAGKTLASKDEIEGLVAELASLGKSDVDIERITEASVALSNVTGKGLNEAFTQINATFTGTAGKLSKLVPELEGMTAKQLEAGGAVDLLNQKFGSISDAMSTGIAQQFSNLGKSVDEFKEAVGANLAPLFSPMVEWISKIVDKWTESMDAHRRYREAIAKGNAEDAAVAQAQLNIMDLKNQAERKNKDIQMAREMIENIKSVGGPVDVREQEASLNRLYKEYAELFKQINENTKTISEIQNKKSPESSSVRPGAATSTGSTSEKKEAPAPFSMLDLQQLFMTEQAYRYAADDAKAPPPQAEPPRGFNMLEIQQQKQTESAYISASQSRGLFGDLGKQLEGFASESTRIFSMLKDDPAEFTDLLTEKLGGLDGILSKAGDALGGVAGELLNTTASMGPMGLLMVGLEKVFEGIAQVLGPLLNGLLTPLVDMLVLVGNVIGQMLAPAFQILTPIVQGLAKLFAWLYNKVFVPVYNFSMSIFNMIYNAFADFVNAILAIIDAIPFVDVGRVSRRGAEEGFLKEIDVSGTSAGSGSGGSSSGSGASYAGSQPIIFNFYNQGNVVGSGGLEELAELINAIIKRNERYA